MSLTSAQQAVDLISRASQILVVTRERPDVDALSAVSAVGEVLKKLHKNFDVAGSSLGPTRTFHLRVDVSKTPLAELRYDVKDGALDITLTPKQGEWTAEDVQTKSGNDRYDLVIAIGTADLASLGEVAKEHADFFLRTPIINVDCHAANERWGQVNLVDVTAVSVTETVYRWLISWNKNFLDSSVATTLFAGMMAATKSFRTPNVTPQTLTAAADLIACGADRQKIVQDLWRTRSLAALKLWGRALTRLKQDGGLVWTALTENDFLESGAHSDDADGVAEELIAYVPDAKVIVLVTQNKSQARATVFAFTPYSAADIIRPFGGTGTRDQATVVLTGSRPLGEAAKELIEKLKNNL